MCQMCQKPQPDDATRGVMARGNNGNDLYYTLTLCVEHSNELAREPGFTVSA